VIIDKKLVVAAPVARLWDLLLDPQAMSACVPGVQSVRVLSDREYSAILKVTISFISATFNFRTTILETRAPHYMRYEGTGEDSKIASSVKHTSELFLTGRPDGTTELAIKSKADVFGRLGTFGLTVMKTKVDRMWDEFAANLAARISKDEPTGQAAS
jgi:carbon monoxide dehydrogenase subunit G